jgi:hypothetical protein
MTLNDSAFIIGVGAGATAITDLWVIVRERVFKVPRPHYGFVGRWVAHMARGQFRHDAIAASPPMAAERTIGWITHYAIGVAFAFVLPAIWGAVWIRQPTFLPAFMVGIGTVVAPYFVMQPAMGAGIAASRTPRPNTARLHSFVMHAVFGIGLYAAALLIRATTIAWAR